MRERIPLQNRLRFPLLGVSAGALLLLILTFGYRIPAPSWFDLGLIILCNTVMALFLFDLLLNVLFEPDRRKWLRSHVPDLILMLPVVVALFNGFSGAGAGLVIAREGFVVYRMAARTRWFQRLP